MRLGVSASVAGKAASGSTPAVDLGYAGTVQNIAGLVSYWRLTSAVTLTDSAGGNNGTFAGTVAAVDGLPTDVAGDGAVDFAAVGTASIPHSSEFLLSAFTLSYWVKPNAIPPEETPTAPLVSKDTTSTHAAGDFSTAMLFGGVVQVAFRDGSAALQTVATDENILVGNTPNHIAVRADGTGFDLWVNGRLWGTNTNYTGAWSANTHAIFLADNPNFVNDADAVLDEIALYNRVLTQAEILALAQSSDPPVTAADAATVDESATTVIDVVTNDTFVGAKDDLTVTIIAQPTGGDSVAVDANNDIEYMAGAVSANTNRTFQYRITDSLGTSNTATVTVTIQNSADPPPSSPQANCFTVNTNDTVTVTNSTQLQTQINAAPPGRTILLGTSFAGGTLTLNPQGTTNNPIVVRPAGARNTVTISDATWTLAPTSSRLVLYGINFTNGRLFVNGASHRVSRCQFRQVTGGYGVRVNAATDTRVDHCDWSGFANNTNTKGCLVLSNADIGNGSLRRVLFDYNYIHDMLDITVDAEDGSNFIRTVSTNNCWRIDPGLVIDHCLIRNTRSPNHGEFIVIKVAGAIIRFCTFENVGGYLQQRQGGGWEVRSNWFESLTRTACLMCWDMFNGGTQSGAGRQLVIGNRLVGSHQLWIGAGTAGDVDQLVPNEYHRSRLGRFIGNIVGGGIRVGEMWDTRVATEPALNNNLFNNTGTVTNVFQSGTTTNSDSEDFTPAVKLVPADVGLGAPDPLCASGPQS